jgi:hypothetical protein
MRVISTVFFQHLRIKQLVSCFIWLFCAHWQVNAQPIAQYFPQNTAFNSAIPTPESVLGFTLGERHLRHDQLVNYLQLLAKSSDRIALTSMGKTYEYREQLLLTISSAENLKQLPDILARRQQLTSISRDPLVIWLGYSVHGDEISGAYAAMAMAYYLAAAQQPLINLDDVIVVIEPSINPDGMDRFTQWVNQYHGLVENVDPNHIEHHQGWLTGRTNHYGFDLNRDWLLLTQIESQNRMRFYRRYLPNVLADFHEMGANSSYFFQPGVPDRTNPITPVENITLTQQLAKYHAKAFDEQQQLYFSEESYDDFYYGKGSTYPDINGAIGILFEQASARGYAQQTDNGVLTLTDGIKNHVTTSLSTLKGAWENKAALAKYRADFYRNNAIEAEKQPISGYLLVLDDDLNKFKQFLSVLKQHDISVYALTKDFRYQGHVYDKNTSFYLPLTQPQYRVIRALFDQPTTFKNNTFYDVSGWTYPLAMNIRSIAIERTWGLKYAEQPWQFKIDYPDILLADDAYAYIFQWSDFYAPKLLNNLLNQGIKARVATQSFTIKTTQQQTFSAGSIVIPSAMQTRDDWRQKLKQIAKKQFIPLYSVNTGNSEKGIDLGSNSLTTLKPINVLLVGGKEVSQYEAGELRYYLEQQGIAATVIEQQRLGKIELSPYTHLILVDGNYRYFTAKENSKISQWLSVGGTIFAQKRGAKWLADQNLLQADYRSQASLKQLYSTDDLTYGQQSALAARQRIAGAIFAVNLDLSHPLAYGYQRSSLPVFRNSTLMFSTVAPDFSQVARYTDKPLLSGFTDTLLINTLVNSPAVVAHNVGKGRVIATNEVLAFRGYWHGTEKIIANSLFFSKVFSAPEKKR